MSLFDFLPWSKARKREIKQGVEEMTEETDQCWENTLHSLKIRQEAGCSEIYDKITYDILQNQGKNLETILKTTPDFDVDLPYADGTLLTLIAGKLPDMPYRTFALFLKRRPNPFIRTTFGQSAQDILKERYDFKHGTSGHRMYSILEDYKMLYVREKRDNALGTSITHQSLPLPKEKGRELGD